MLLFMRLEARPPTHRLVREVGWKKRDHVTMVLNMDNNAMPDSKKKSFGGLMHNFEGTFQFDFLW